MREITPLPWVVESCGQKNCWCSCVSSVTLQDDRDDLEGCVAYSGCLKKADAEFIVRACNAHDDLLAALKVARDELNGDRIEGDWTESLGIVEAAIAKAEVRSAQTEDEP